MFCSSGDVKVGDLLELPQGCQEPFRDSRGKLGFLSRHHGRKRSHLALRGESPGFSQVAAANMGFLSSNNGDIRDTLVGLRKVRSPCEL